MAYPNDQQPQLKFIFCNQCGMKLPANSNFCSRCGNRIVILNQPSDPVKSSQQEIPSDPKQYVLKVINLSDRVLKESSVEALNALVSLTEETKRFVAQGAAYDPERYRVSGIHFSTLAWYYMTRELKPETAEEYAVRARKDFMLGKNFLQSTLSTEDLQFLDDWINKMKVYEAFCAMERKDYKGAIDKIKELNVTLETLAIVTVAMTEIRVEEGGDLFQCYQGLSQWDQQMRRQEYLIDVLFEQKLFRKAYSNLSFLVLHAEDVDLRIPHDEATIRDLMIGLENIKGHMTDPKERLYIEFDLKTCREKLGAEPSY